MRAKDWFALGVRILGVVNLLYGLGSLLDALLFRLGYFHFPDSTPGYYVVTGLAFSVVGLFLIRGASALVAFAYPEPVDDDDQEDDEADQEDA